MTDRATASGVRMTLAGRAYGWVLLAGLLVMLGANLPGHMTYDSVTQLFEGRTGQRVTWSPGVMSWILGAFDRIVPGTGLYVVANALVLFAALLGLQRLRPRTSWLGVAVAAGAMATPSILIYQGIVWRDVMFANLAVAAFVALAFALRAWPVWRARWVPLGLAVVLFAGAILARQNGFVLLGPAALLLLWTTRTGGWMRAGLWTLGFLAAVILLAQAAGAAVQPKGTSQADDTSMGLRIIRRYDTIGAIAHQPDMKLDLMAKVDPAAARTIETRAAQVYSPTRVDTMAAAPDVTTAFGLIPEDVHEAQWREIVTRRPGAYLHHRLDVFIWLAAPPEPRLCLPFSVGVDGPPDRLAKLGVPAGQDSADLRLYAYGMGFLGTPLFSHLAFGGLALVVMLAALWRREPADLAIAGLMAGALAFAVSFFPIAVACDYRYLYPLDLAAIAGLIYLALDPPRLRRARAT